MVAAWGESNLDEEKERTEVECAHLCHMAKIEDKEEPSNSKVCFNTIEEELTKLNKSQLVNLILETLADYKKVCVKRNK